MYTPSKFIRLFLESETPQQEGLGRHENAASIDMVYTYEWAECGAR